jgi:multidrug efflux pump subunit AcrA (membrane-fusion protein)
VLANKFEFEVIVLDDPRRAEGQVTVIENTVEPTSGLVPVRATMPNTNGIQWPGTLVMVRSEFRKAEDRYRLVDRQPGRPEDGVAVTVAVSLARLTLLENGLNGGATVVIEGSPLLNDGSKVSAR